MRFHDHDWRIRSNCSRDYAAKRNTAWATTVGNRHGVVGDEVTHLDRRRNAAPHLFGPSTSTLQSQSMRKHCEAVELLKQEEHFVDGDEWGTFRYAFDTLGGRV